VDTAHRPCDSGAAPGSRSEPGNIRVYQVIALVVCLCGIAIALRWPQGWGVPIAFAGFVVTLILEWRRTGK
jgi:hypothetical protein